MPKFKSLWQILGYIFIAIIYLICLMPIDSSASPDIPGFDKLVHGSIYLFITLWFLQLNLRQKTLKAFILFVLMGLSIECLQSFTPYRQFEWFDVLANSSGSFIAILVFKSGKGEFLLFVEKHLVKIP
jgi:VanZ family protein